MSMYPQECIPKKCCFFVLRLCCRFVLRNWMAQIAIQQSERGDHSEVRNLLNLLKEPFTTEGEDEAFQAALDPSNTQQQQQHTTVTGVTAADDYEAVPSTGSAQAAAAAACSNVRNKYDRRPPAWASQLCVTCSS